MGSHETEPNTTLPTPSTPAGRDGLDAILARPGKAVI
ncbi:trehalose-phosphatase, partial [Streptomyces sp. PSKA30]|nr:trehalose-phosphatase [Streptomyces sp. PSKA30]